MRFHVSGLVCCLAITSPLSCVPAAFAQGGFFGPGSYQITNVKSGKVLSLDLNDRSTVTQYGPQNRENQVWIVDPAPGGNFYIRNAVNGNALEPTGGQKSAAVVAAPFRSTPSQQWRMETGKDGNFLIRNSFGKVLDLPDGSSQDGVRMQIYDSNGDSNQRFIFRKVSGNWGNGWRPGPGGPGGPGFPGGPRGPGGPLTITCSSDDGRRNYCQADTRRGVYLSRQISGSPCRQNQTWGYDGRGIWVDRGCRAEFQVGGR
jgi:hypothetical protein